MKINDFTEDSPYSMFKRWASKKTHPAQYEKAAQTLHDVLVRKVKATNGKLRHGLGYYAQQIGKSFKGIDTRALIDVYKDMYGHEGLAEFKIVKPDPKDTMGVKRNQMPQVATKDYPEFLDYLKDNGATFTKDTVPADSLKAIQGEFSDQGVEKALKLKKIEKPIIASSDNYIIDGHHRWLAALNTGEEVNVFRVDIPGQELLKLVKDFPKTTYKDIYTERLVKVDPKGPKNLKKPVKISKYAKRKAMMQAPDDLQENAKPHLYLDMDGVQADFFGQWAKWHSEQTGKRVGSYRDIGDAEAQLASIVKMSNEGPDFVRDFFASLPPLNGFNKVLNWIKNNNIPFSILSAPLRGNNKASIEGKKQWLSQHNPGAEQEIFTGNKENYATSGGQANVLIDDHGKYIQRWTSKGGIGIKHSNANPQATIDALEQIYNLNEADEVVPMLYHATYRPFLDSIMKNGLGGKGAQTQWEDSKPGYVYLAKDPEVAISHAEANEEVPDEYIDNIVVLSIDASQLDQDNLEDDPNVIDDDSTLAYKGIIPVSAFNVNESSSKDNYGIPDSATLAQLDSIAKNAKSKEKRQRAHWLRNMRRGANKKK